MSPEEAWIRIGRPTLSRVLTAAGLLIGLVVVTIPDERHVERHPLLAVYLPIMLLFGVAPAIVLASRRRAAWIIAGAGIAAGIVRGLTEIENMDGRSECMPPPHPDILPMLVTAAFFGAVGFGLGWLGLGSIAREARAEDARDLHLLPSVLANQSRWLAAAALVACARSAFVVSACVGVVAVAFLVAFLVVTTQRDTFAAAVLAGERFGWIAEDSAGDILLCLVRPIASPYRGSAAPEPVARLSRNIRPV